MKFYYDDNSLEVIGNHLACSGGTFYVINVDPNEEIVQYRGY